MEEMECMECNMMMRSDDMDEMRGMMMMHMMDKHGMMMSEDDMSGMMH
ncbi:hypothetical protein [Halomarina pelagica]|nr:hypothetical protein [Halomarina sp. BND7]